MYIGLQLEYGGRRLMRTVATFYGKLLLTGLRRITQLPIRLMADSVLLC